MRLTGEQIYLRPITDADTDNILKWRNSQSVKKHFIYQKDFTRAGHNKWMEEQVKTGAVVQFIICQQGGEAIGSVFLRDIDKDNNKAEYGIFIGQESQRGIGIGREAARLVVRYGFEELKLHKIFLRVFADNVAAVKSYERAGFSREAYLKDEVRIDGRYRDIILMAVINNEEE